MSVKIESYTKESSTVIVVNDEYIQEFPNEEIADAVYNAISEAEHFDSTGWEKCMKLNVTYEEPGETLDMIEELKTFHAKPPAAVEDD